MQKSGGQNKAALSIELIKAAFSQVDVFKDAELTRALHVMTKLTHSHTPIHFPSQSGKDLPKM
jgi:hypothetical protein